MKGMREATFVQVVFSFKDNKESIIGKMCNLQMGKNSFVNREFISSGDKGV